MTMERSFWLEFVHGSFVSSGAEAYADSIAESFWLVTERTMHTKNRAKIAAKDPGTLYSDWAISEDGESVGTWCRSRINRAVTCTRMGTRPLTHLKPF